MEKALPHFINRHNRQDFGFEGPDLELRRRREIEQRAESIPKEHIEPNGPGKYRVRSQTQPDHWYTIDLDSYYCECDGFPLINFCKHIFAVQRHFQHEPPQIAFPATPNLHEPAAAALALTEDQGMGLTDLSRICHKINILASRTRLFPPQTLTDALQKLEPVIDRATRDLNPPILPKAASIPPNQGSWKETAAVMGVKAKSKRKTHTDPYGGGERSGKKAKPDAKGPTKLLKPRRVHCLF
jgi:hypothetical protein